MQIVGFGDLEQFLFRPRAHGVPSFTPPLQLLFVAIFKDFLDDGKSRKRIGPSCIEGKMSHYLGYLFFRQTVVHGAVQMVGDLCYLSGSNERANRYKTAITRCQRGPQPQLTEEQVRGVLDKPRRDLAEVVVDLRSSVSLGFFIQRKQLIFRGWQL